MWTPTGAPTRKLVQIIHDLFFMNCENLMDAAVSCSEIIALVYFYWNCEKGKNWCIWLCFHQWRWNMNKVDFSDPESSLFSCLWFNTRLVGFKMRTAAQNMARRRITWKTSMRLLSEFGLTRLSTNPENW